MYNPDGADTKREWIRVQNSGEVEINLSGWKLREGGTNHKVTPTGASTLAPGQYAIIADDAAVSASEYPKSTDLVFDSAFSLKNSGESLAILDSSGRVAASTSYSGDAAVSRTVSQKATSVIPKQALQSTTLEVPRGVGPYIALLVALGMGAWGVYLLTRKEKSPSRYTIVAHDKE